MKRAGHYILNGLTLLSLMLFAATAGLWMSSYGRTSTFRWRQDDQTCHFVSSHRGRVEVISQSVAPAFTRGVQVSVSKADVATLGTIILGPGIIKADKKSGHPSGRFGAYRIRRDPHRLDSQSYGFGWGRSDFARVVAVPYWFITTAIFAATAWQLWRWNRRMRRVRTGFCSKCGYDLRATPERCPECGMVPSTVKA